nr:reverse transcriptase domain, reverse transcriptase zinc-binding domain protein [Tanacetum cinerariifolium]
MHDSLNTIEELHHLVCKKAKDAFFYFAHGDTYSARVIKEAFEEFKSVLGLVLNLPKSRTYFCNASNHTRLAILRELLFEKGTLLVKYMGVPLISTCLVYRDCKELVERVQDTIRNWKNKFLYFAGRLQLVQSIFSSMHVYWSSVFILPTRVILDIEQLMRGSWLWPNDWYIKFPALCTVNVPSLVTDLDDSLVWRNILGIDKSLSVGVAWEGIRPCDNVIAWTNAI